MPSSQIERKLAAIMFTDIAGYTAQMSKDEDKAFSLIQKKRELLLPLVEKYEGKLIKEMGEDSAEVAAFDEKYRKENPYPYSTLSQVLDHIDHVVELIGIDHVGIGSDFDGVGDSLPTGLKDVSTYPNLVQGMLDRGYSRADIEKVLSGNLLRVWSEVEKYAAAH